MVKFPVNKKEEKKPNLIDLNSDFVLIRTLYDQKYFTKFYHDYKFLNYHEFMQNITFLGGDFAELIRLRRGLIGEVKLSKEELVHAHKNFLTPEIEKYRNKEQKKTSEQSFVGLMKNLGNQLEENRKKNKNKKNRR